MRKFDEGTNSVVGAICLILIVIAGLIMMNYHAAGIYKLSWSFSETTAMVFGVIVFIIILFFAVRRFWPKKKRKAREGRLFFYYLKGGGGRDRKIYI